MRSTFDYIIVGAGTAGCVLANRLSANPKTQVLLLEAGKKDDYFWIDIPVGYLYTIGNPRTDWCYQTEPDPGLNGRSIGYARGKVLGGCSSINAMIYMRGQRDDFDHWQSLGNKDWGWDDVLPIFKMSEDYQHGPDDFHGVGGEKRVEALRLADIFRASVVDSTLKSFVFQITGTPEKIDAFAELMEPLGLNEIARTGIAAISRGK